MVSKQIFVGHHNFVLRLFELYWGFLQVHWFLVQNLAFWRPRQLVVNEYSLVWYKLFSILFIGYKLAKYDRGPDSIKLKISPSGRIVWSPQMLQKLQEARQTAQTISARSGKKLFFYHPAMFFLLLAVYTLVFCYQNCSELLREKIVLEYWNFNRPFKSGRLDF